MDEIKKWAAGAVINDRYRIEEFLGKGGMGKTYRALDMKSGKKVALKFLSFAEIDDWKVIELFEREARTLASLDHPRIPDYYDMIKIGEGKNIVHVLVQEYIEGKNLLELINGGKRFTITEIESILKSLLEIVSYIHSLHPCVVHRDINPKNIIISNDNAVYLADFGAVADPSKTGAGSTIIGTPGYMPQEQLYGKITPASDVYALGATIVFMLTGKEPSGLELKNMRLDYHHLADIPSSLRKLLDHMLDPDYSRRIPDAKKALAIFEGREQAGLQESDEFEGAENVIVRKTGEGFREITFKKKPFIYIFLIFFSIAWDSFLFFFISGIGDFGSESGLPPFILLFMLPFFAVGVFLFGFILYGFFGKLSIVLTGDALIYNNMIFGYTFKTISIPFDKIRGIKILKEYGSKGSVAHVLSITASNQVLKIGRMQNLTEDDLDSVRILIEKAAGRI